MNALRAGLLGQIFLRCWALRVAFILIGISALLWSRPVFAATITVNTTADELNSDGDCSLREAVRAANLNMAVDACTAGQAAPGVIDTITIPAGTYTLASPGADEDAGETGDLDVTEPVDMTGASAATTIIDGNALDRVIEIFDIEVNISQMTVRNGANADGAGINVGTGSVTLTRCIVTSNHGFSGGGIRSNIAFLFLTDTTVSNNSATGDGGGIWNGGGLSIDRSTISGNSALGSGGGIFAERAPGVQSNSTISGNSAAGHGGGMFVRTAFPSLRNMTITNNATTTGLGNGGGLASMGGPVGHAHHTIIAGNTDVGGQASDCSGSLMVENYNILGNSTGCSLLITGVDNVIGTGLSPIDPKLKPLANNGGPTLTHALLGDSPALDAITLGGCLSAEDQRGFSRPRDGNGDFIALCDIGAVESEDPVQQTFTVNTTDDTDDRTCDVAHCSLREALLAANANPGKDEIAFNISGPAPHTIQPLSPLPEISERVIFDGNFPPEVEIDGSLAGFGVDGLVITGTKSVIQGLTINRFSGDGVVMIGPNARGNQVLNSYIGTDTTGTVALGNGSDPTEENFGVRVGTDAKTSRIQGNVISGNVDHGVGFESDEVAIQDNYIGTTPDGEVAVPNGGHGIIIERNKARHADVLDNIVSGNNGTGIVMLAGAHTLLRNGIGTNKKPASGTLDPATAGVPNLGDGILIGGTSAVALSDGQLTGGNVIAFNAGNGVRVDAGIDHLLFGNFIFANGDLGIDLDSDGVTLNDTDDVDAGPNDLLNFPTITAATATSITLTLHSLARTTFNIQFFASDTCDPSGFGEGQNPLDITSISTNGSGNFSGTIGGLTVPSGKFLTAVTTMTSGSTSEFSPCFGSSDADGDGVDDNLDVCPDTPPAAAVDFNGCSTAQGDADGDSLYILQDNCPDVVNFTQTDSDDDGFGDACDDDSDNDTVPDDMDDCPEVYNPGEQAIDGDGDTVTDACDNCPLVANADQLDSNENGRGDACEIDSDLEERKKPKTGKSKPTNPALRDSDNDGRSDAWETANLTNPNDPDTDHDGSGDGVDNCPIDANADQLDTDRDGLGTPCDGDDDADGKIDGADNCPFALNPAQENLDSDALGDVCDDDADGDLFVALRAGGTDCDDRAAASYPGAKEILGNTRDDDCNSLTADRAIDLVLVVSDPADPSVTWDTWLPQVGRTAVVSAFVTGLSTSPTVTLTVQSISSSLGQYTNDASGDASPDFQIGAGGNPLTLHAFDFGGQVLLHARAAFTLPDGTAVVLEKDFTLPKDTDNDGLPDAWEQQFGDLSATEDSDTSESNPYVGDGLTAAEEYRGFVWGSPLVRVGPDETYQTPAYVLQGPVEHFRGNPQRKDLFVKFTGYDPVNPFALGAALSESAGLNVHAAPSEAGFGEEHIDALLVRNLPGTYQGANGHINKRGVRSWAWDTKGASGQGSAAEYGDPETFQLPLDRYFADRPYVDAGPVNGLLDSLALSAVEDDNDSGGLDAPTVKKSEDLNRNGFLDGDLVVPNAFGRDLSAFDIDNDGLVELPVVNDPQQIPAHVEYSKAHVLMHTITHEVGHAIGMNHNQDAACLMYEQTPNWSRAHCLSPSSKAEIQIHNE